MGFNLQSQEVDINMNSLEICDKSDINNRKCFMLGVVNRFPKKPRSETFCLPVRHQTVITDVLAIAAF